MFWFQTNKIPIAQTEKGSHGRHWYGLFDKYDEELVMQYVTKTYRSAQLEFIDKNTFFISEFSLRLIIQNNRIITGFPYWKGTRYENLETKLITEWSHVNQLEAIVQVVHSSGCKFDFFAIDYAFHKEHYINQKNIKANIVGFIYALENFDCSAATKQLNASSHTELTLLFDESFCGYGPTNESDEIDFVGHIKGIEAHALGDIEGFIVTIALTPNFTMDTFIAKTNLKIDLVLNKQVAGLLWIIGTLEK